MGYTTSSIKYYRVNAVNTVLATSNSGDGNPTEEITAPSAGGTFASYNSGTKTVTGQAGSTFNSFAVDQYLYYTNPSTGEYVLVGQIFSIAIGGLSLVLTATPVNAPGVGNVLSAAYSLITTNESIYMRIATGAFGSPPNQREIPDFGINNWRLNDNLVGINNSSQTALERISIVGTPLSNGGATNVPFTFETMNLFEVATTGSFQGTTYFSSTSSLPSYIWIMVIPDGTNTALSSQTLYRFTTQENTASIPIGVQTTVTTLRNAGYNNLPTSGTGNDGG
jgi:hypothetical protein